jgi:MFS family permease
MFQKGQTAKQILVLASVLLIAIIMTGFNATSISILIPGWQKEMNLTDSQYGLIGGAISLGSLFTALIGGVLIDKVRNYKNLLFIFVILNGLTVMARLFTDSFVAIYGALICTGLVAGLVGAGVYKLLPAWFDRKGMYRAVGIMTSGGSIGYILGFTVTIPATQAIGWHNLYLVHGAIIAVMGLLFLIFIPFKEEAKGAMNTELKIDVEGYTLRRKVAEVFKTKQVWMSVIADFFTSGAVLSLSQIGPIALITYWGITDGEAGTILATSSIGSLFGYWIVPPILDKIGYRKRTFIPAAIIGLLCLGLSLLTKNASIAIVLLLIGGFLNACSVVGPRTIMLEHPKVAGLKAGTASGVLITTNKLACVFYPILFMTLYGTIGLIPSWFVFFGLAFVGVIFIALSDETGPKAIARKAALAAAAAEAKTQTD